jgi:hypothetical protein
VASPGRLCRAVFYLPWSTTLEHYPGRLLPRRPGGKPAIPREAPTPKHSAGRRPRPQLQRFFQQTVSKSAGLPWTTPPGTSQRETEDAAVISSSRTRRHPETTPAAAAVHPADRPEAGRPTLDHSPGRLPSAAASHPEASHGRADRCHVRGPDLGCCIGEPADRLPKPVFQILYGGARHLGCAGAPHLRPAAPTPK